GERGHRRAVESEGHRAEDIAHGRSALELAVGEIGRADRKLEVVGQVGGRDAVALAAVAVALEALGLAIEILPTRDELGGGLGRIVDRGRRLERLVLPAAREGLDERDDREALLVRKLMPRGHRRPAHPTRHRAVEIAVGRQRARRRRAELEDAQREVAGTGSEKRRGQAVAVPVLAVTADAAGLIDLTSEREEILASRDVHDRHADRLRLEHFSPRTSVGAELLDVADQTDQLLRGEYQGDPLERGRLV